ncbi:DUF4097 family beta strand repeat-containing protein [Autumnicola musiva]|uniref:Adhesin domain-containing protein n=1 Tax=Autumnicola musiva TaxID=3075589 RepID=A0ABU3D132_9FLAO|nr:hypothetical protein [Zunongwangia sp. F117]MDT0675247.1 hypothetical protein [Zunongwangia sp. F117]
MKRILSALFIFFSLLPVKAQKDVAKIIDASNLDIIEINFDEVYKINIKASETAEIQITTHSEGEYYNNIHLKTEVSGRKLIISSEYPEAFTGGFDKLSAHKVFSLEVNMMIPANRQVYLDSNIASVTAEGDYEDFQVNLEQGYCRLLDFNGNATINTYEGDIAVRTNFAKIRAESRSGTLNVEDLANGTNLLNLTSINGDISVLKTK